MAAEEIRERADDGDHEPSAGAAERYDTDLLHKRLPGDGSVRLANITTSRGCFVVAGPCSRAVLGKLTDTKLDNEAFPWLTGQVAEVGLATDVFLLRVNFVGSLGWELHFPIEYANHLFEAIFAAGEEFGIGMAGMRAMESLRMEKSYRMWGSDLTRENTPFEAGLDRFVRMKKGEFAGRAALEAQLAKGVPNRFVTLDVHGVTDADPLGNLHVAATVIPDIDVDQWNVRYLRFEPDGEVVSAWVSCMAQLSDIVALSDGTPVVSYSNPLPGNTIQLASPG